MGSGEESLASISPEALHTQYTARGWYYQQQHHITGWVLGLQKTHRKQCLHLQGYRSLSLVTVMRQNSVNIS